MKIILSFLTILFITTICLGDTNQCNRAHYDIEATYKTVTNNVLVLQQFYYWDCSMGIMQGSKDIRITFDRVMEPCPPNTIVTAKRLHYNGTTNEVQYYTKCLK